MTIDDIGPWDMYYQRVMRLSEDAKGISMLFTLKANLDKMLIERPNYLGPDKDLFIEAYIRDHNG